MTSRAGVRVRYAEEVAGTQEGSEGVLAAEYRQSLLIVAAPGHMSVIGVVSCARESQPTHITDPRSGAL